MEAAEVGWRTCLVLGARYLVVNAAGSDAARLKADCSVRLLCSDRVHVNCRSQKCMKRYRRRSCAVSLVAGPQVYMARPIPPNPLHPHHPPTMIKSVLGSTAGQPTVPQELVFVTGNANKLREVQAILGSSVPSLTNRALDLPELQGTIEDVTLDKAQRAAAEVCPPPRPPPFAQVCLTGIDRWPRNRRGYVPLLQRPQRPSWALREMVHEGARP